MKKERPLPIIQPVTKYLKLLKKVLTIIQSNLDFVGRSKHSSKAQSTSEYLNLLGKGSSKGQSAMEYLMTYGWSILIVAIALISLFELGIFNSSNFSSSGSCIADSGYLCSTPVFATNGTLTVLAGESFGLMTITKTACLNGTAQPSATGFNTIIPVTLNSGQTAPVSFYCPLSSNTLGTSFSGSLWLQYDKGGVNGQEARMAKAVLKATVSGSFSGSGTPQKEYYIPITIQNTQSTATSGNFQQMINITENNYATYLSFNGNIANFEYVYQNGTVIPGWIESNDSGKLITWARIAPQIPAQSSLKIYLALAANTVNLLSSSGTSGIGEAPQLSPSYAEYDNGADIFNFYDNFAGDILNLNWEKGCQGTSSLPTVSVNNGVTVNAIVNNNCVLYTSTNIFGINIVADYFGQPPEAFGAGLGPEEDTGPNYAFSNIGLNNNVGAGCSGNLDDLSSWWGGSLCTNYPAFGTGHAVWTVSRGSATANIISLRNYDNSYNTIINQGLSFNLGWTFSGYGIMTTYFIQWVRTRIYPPNGVMPTATLGSIS